MGDYELVVTTSKRLEAMLETGFGAEGRGLHEKVTSVQARLPEPLVKKLRYIATIRNKLVHDEDVDRIDDRASFQRAGKEAERQLAALLRPAGAGWIGLRVKLILLAIACLAAALLWFVWSS